MNKMELLTATEANEKIVNSLEYKSLHNHMWAEVVDTINEAINRGDSNVTYDSGTNTQLGIRIVNRIEDKLRNSGYIVHRGFQGKSELVISWNNL
ncbi:hypothetical protein HMPREF0877_0095 [Weissella paramesenteroides ATCC 33313]|uniref:Uncharacterized protein n=2 Tax=Weissella paramesenteroides TaxID=1249 RepID=C5R800_WEIPA|nr:hypothetical protein HMPREF0877_0095 [Weissella paramesenteroides ATCC 33313]